MPDDDRHIVYVWIDALTNYLTALEFPNLNSDNIRKFWPADFHIVGKDILRFHAIYWPALLMAAELPLPKKIIAHGWWTVEKEKMSKSLGNVIDPDDMISKYGLDQFRYFLLKEVPFGNDGDFSQNSLIARVNSELANNYGNLVNRVFSMTMKNLNGIVPEVEITERESDLIKISDEKISDYMVQFKIAEFSKAISSAMDIVSSTNKYIDETQPWKLAKDNDHEGLKRVLRTSLEMIRLISILLFPIMPDSSKKILNALNIKIDDKSNSFSGFNKIESLLPGTTIKKLDLLFNKIDKTEG